MAGMQEPSLVREIGKVAWLVTKVTLGAAVLLAAVFQLFRHHLRIGIGVIYVLVLADVAALLGGQTTGPRSGTWSGGKGTPSVIASGARRRRASNDRRSGTRAVSVRCGPGRPESVPGVQCRGT